MIIEYMYLKVKTALIKIMFPLFIVKAIILELVIFKNEQLIKKLITKENELVQDILDPSEIIISWKV